MAKPNVAHYLQNASFNINELNLTSENINDFVQHIINLKKNPNGTSSFSMGCNDFCSGPERNMLSHYKNMHGYISLAICIFGTIANILNIIVLTRKEMSKTQINLILKWLSVTDMFVMIDYIPFSIYMYLIFPGKREFQYTWAVYLLFHMHFSQILHTISILLTMTLAIWRYLTIKHPHTRLASIILAHCKTAIIICFILAPILCLPLYFVFRINEKYIDENQKMVLIYHLDAREDIAAYRINFWIHSVIIKILPCIVLTIISFILIGVLYSTAKRKMKLKDYNGSSVNPQHIHRATKNERRPDRTTMLLVAVLILFLLTEIPQGVLGLLSGILQKCFLIRCYSMFGELMDLLALINAAIGFVLYGLMSKQFRTSFRAVFFNGRSSRTDMTKVTAVTTTCV